MVEHTDECPVFVPLEEDLSKPFAAFVESKEAECLEFGICKITPGAGWVPCSAEDRDEDLVNKITPSNQSFTLDKGATGTYKADIKSGHSVTVSKFSEEDVHVDAKLATLRTFEDYEQLYWRTLAGGEIPYGSDIEGSKFKANVQVRTTMQ